jgi:hypothetical protein
MSGTTDAGIVAADQSLALPRDLIVIPGNMANKLPQVGLDLCLIL